MLLQTILVRNLWQPVMTGQRNRLSLPLKYIFESNDWRIARNVFTGTDFRNTLFSYKYCRMCHLFIAFNVRRWSYNEFIMYRWYWIFASSVFSIIYSLAFQECPSKMNQISGLMITAVAGGGVITPMLGLAIDMGGITAGLFVILLCVAYLMYCAFGIKVKRR